MEQSDAPPRELTLEEAVALAILLQKGEQLVASFGLIDDTPSSVYGILSDADLPWPTIKLSDGQDLALVSDAGTPVVATAVGGIRELITDGETGFLAPAGNPEALSNRICRALAEEHQSLELGMRGRSFVLSRFAIQRTVAEVQGVYDQLAAECGKRQ